MHINDIKYILTCDNFFRNYYANSQILIIQRNQNPSPLCSWSWTFHHSSSVISFLVFKSYSSVSMAFGTVRLPSHFATIPLSSASKSDDPLAYIKNWIDVNTLIFHHEPFKNTFLHKSIKSKNLPTENCSKKIIMNMVFGFKRLLNVYVFVIKIICLTGFCKSNFITNKWIRCEFINFGWWNHATRLKTKKQFTYQIRWNRWLIF